MFLEDYFSCFSDPRISTCQGDKLWLLRSKSEQSGRRRRGRSHSYPLSLVPCKSKEVSRGAVRPQKNKKKIIRANEGRAVNECKKKRKKEDFLDEIKSCGVQKTYKTKLDNEPPPSLPSALPGALFFDHMIFFIRKYA